LEKELIINASAADVQIALLEDRRLVELHSQKTNANFTVGDIFLGRIQKLNPGMNAAFVDIGHKKDAFLHYTDLGPKLRSLQKYTNGAISGGQHKAMLDDFKMDAEIVKTGKVADVLARKQFVLVQIMKEPISSKGHRLSCEISLPGRYIVLTPFQDNVAVSKKISSSEERKRLLAIAEGVRPKNFGMIVRTAAEGKSTAELHQDVTNQVNRWEQIHRQLHKATGAKKLLSELDKTSSILRDLLNDTFTRIVVDDREMHTDILEYIKHIAPDKTDIAKLYTGTKPIFEHFGVTRQIKAAFGKTANLPSGAYIVIEHTEAMHVIDVNSGHKTNSTDQENNAITVNLEAAEEIARQLRLRDIGGIIMVDFIDMRKLEHKKQLYQKLKEAMRRDTAKHTILPLSKFGIMQITRQRVRPEVNITTAEHCPACNGTGTINPTVLVTDDILRDVDFILKNQAPKSLLIEVHPFVQAYLTTGLWRSQQFKWYWQYKKWIRVRGSIDRQISEYKFFDEQDEEIRLS
jgi:ribonuclease G